MIGKNKSATPATYKNISPDTIIGEGTEIHGTFMKGDECVRIDGTVIGDSDPDGIVIETNGLVIIGAKGYIRGKALCNQIVVAGAIEGDIHCKTVAHLTATAFVNGNIQADYIIVDEGACLDGAYKIGEERIKNQEPVGELKKKSKKHLNDIQREESLAMYGEPAY